MPLPLNKRDFDIFLSHAHKDRTFVAKLDRWLTETAGLRVWYDARELSGGALLATDLQRAIERCRGILLVASEDSLAHGWVKAEYNSAMDERANQEGFRVVALRLGNANTSGMMRGVTWVDVPMQGLDRDAALAVIQAYYPGKKWPNPNRARDIYISCSWRSADSTSARAVCRHLIDQGFRLVGDAQDQKGFAAGNRVERIIKSCGAFVAIVPFRGSESASAGDGPYKYFVREMEMAKAHGLPCVIVADPRVRRPGGGDETWLPMETDATDCPPDVAYALESLWDEWREPVAPQYVFCALDLDSESARAGSAIRHLIERVTGMPTVVGNEIHEEPLHSAIVKKIRDAFLVLADITDNNINACIEAGMGLAVGANVEILSHGVSRRPPFMLRSLQMPTYLDEIEQLGVVHRVVRPYRRRIINAEL